MMRRGSEVKVMAIYARERATRERVYWGEQIVASNAICDAIPNGNNV